MGEVILSKSLGSNGGSLPFVISSGHSSSYTFVFDDPIAIATIRYASNHSGHCTALIDPNADYSQVSFNNSDLSIDINKTGLSFRNTFEPSIIPYWWVLEFSRS